MRRGDVFWVRLSPAVGTELRDLHPCVVVQSDLVEHELRPRTIVVPVTSRAPKRPLPFVVTIEPPEGGLVRTSYVLCDQVTRVDKTRILKCTGSLSAPMMDRINASLRLVLEL
ncbi:MAG: type II toxin-antitoxin system PemK/MazF family toxin [Armatimonadetes bacterium]|nr:type II toxin-antitoxin system PemK/MazF family toxin [Armatimonadota bacterium]